MKSRSFFPVLRSRMRQKQEVDGNESHQEVELAKNSTLKPRQFCCSEWVFHHPPTIFYQLMCQWCYSWCSTCSSCAIRAPRVSDAHLCPPPTLGHCYLCAALLPLPSRVLLCSRVCTGDLQPKGRSGNGRQFSYSAENEEQKKIPGQQLVVKDIFGGGGIIAGSLQPFCTAVSITQHCIQVLQQDPAARGMGISQGKKTLVLLLHSCLSKCLGLIVPQYFLSSLLRNT